MPIPNMIRIAGNTDRNTFMCTLNFIAVSFGRM
jgi:hypothetical protein